MDISNLEHEAEHKAEGMSDSLKIATLLGTLGLTGLVAYWCRDGGPLDGKKKASGSIAFPYDTPTYPIGSPAWYDWISKHRAQGLSVGVTGKTTTPTQVYRGSNASIFQIAGSVIGTLSAGSTVTYLGEAPVERADFTDSVTGIQTLDSWISRSAVMGSHSTTAAQVFNGVSGQLIGTLSPGSGVSRKRSFSRASVSDSVTGIQTPDVWIANDAVQWPASQDDVGSDVTGGMTGGAPDFDETAIQAAPEYTSWHARWGERFWERPEWRTQFGERFRRFDETAIRSAPEYASWHARWGERFWERPEWRTQFGERFRHDERRGDERRGDDQRRGDVRGDQRRGDVRGDVRGDERRGDVRGDEQRRGDERRDGAADTSAYHHGQAWAASQTAETASRTAMQSGSTMHHQTAATSHQYAASSHQAAAAALQAPAATAPSTGRPATLSPMADKLSLAPLIASHQAAATSHQAAAQEHTAAAQAPQGSASATSHAATAVSHAATATQHAASAHRAG